MIKHLVFIALIFAFIVQCRADKCDVGGSRYEDQKYCGFGWKILDFSGTENWGESILFYLVLPFKTIFVILIGIPLILIEEIFNVTLFD